MPTAYDDISLLPIDPSQFQAPYPSDAKVSQVQQQIHDARSLIDQCDLEIGRLRSTISSLEKQKRRITRRIDEYRALISPVRKIPVEIWTEIFSIFLEDSCNLHITYYKISTPTLRLSHVCSFWRAIVMSTPKLWTHLRIDLMHSSDEMVEAVAFYLDRAKTDPLCLELAASYHISGRFGHQGRQVFKLLLDVHARWFKVNLDFDRRALDEIEIDREIERHLGTMSICCDILQSFSVSTFANGAPPVNLSLQLLRLLEKAPRLESFNSDYFDKSFAPLFSNLVDIRFGFLSMEDVLFCLSICPKLERADFAINDVNGGFGETMQVCHVKLRSLKFSFRIYAINSEDTFKGLTLPALSRLEFKIWGKNYTSLQNLLLRSRCPLEYLKLYLDPFTSDQELAQLLSLTPKLSHLELEPEMEWTPAFFQIFTLKDGRTPVLPRLEFLHVRLYKNFALPEPEVILSMIKSRKHFMNLQGQNKRLDRFVVDFSLTDSAPATNQWVWWFTSRAEPGLQVLKEENGRKTQLQIRVSV